MKPLIELCENNVPFGAESVYQRLKSDDRIDVEKIDCLGECSLCAQKVFAMCEGEILRGETAHDLVEKIYAFLIEEDYLDSAFE